MQSSEAQSFMERMSRETGVKLATGLNAFTQYADIGDYEHVEIMIDPTGFSESEECFITSYAEDKGLRVEALWNDWGRYIKLSDHRKPY